MSAEPSELLVNSVADLIIFNVNSQFPHSRLKSSTI